MVSQPSATSGDQQNLLDTTTKDTIELGENLVDNREFETEDY